MLKNVHKEKTGYRSSYTDIANKSIEVIHSVVMYSNSREEHEKQIVQDLYMVFKDD